MEKEKKIELECDYCGTPITVDQHKCPSCGANCSDKIKKYKKQQEKLEEEKKAAAQEKSQQVAEDMTKAVMMPARFIIIIAIAMFAFITIMAVVGMSSMHQDNDIILINEESDEKEEDLDKSVFVSYNELAKTDDFDLILDSYELYEYVSDTFPDSYNTPEGYQKIAFHFIYTNHRKSEEYLSTGDLHITADDYKVESANLKTGTFERAVSGQANYPTLLGSRVGSNEKLQGYVGYLIPKNATTLKFTMDSVTITMDNPVFVGE